MEKWEKLSSSYAFDTPWVKVRKDCCRLPNGHIVDDFYVVETHDWVIILALDEDNRVVLVRQYRHPINEFSLELPAGNIDPGEDAVTAAKRELLEETGYTAEHLHVLPKLHANSGRQDNWAHFVVATGIKKTAEPDPELTEQIETELITIPDLLKLTDQGIITQGLHVSGIFLGLRHLNLL